MRIQRDPDNSLPDNKLFLEEKEENSDSDIEEKLQEMSSMETDKRLSSIFFSK